MSLGTTILNAASGLNNFLGQNVFGTIPKGTPNALAISFNQQGQTPVNPVATPHSGLVNSQFAPYIGTRPSTVDPTVTEFYNAKTGQGFANQSDLFKYAGSLGFGTVNGFGDLARAPIQAGPALTAGPPSPSTGQNNQPYVSAASTGFNNSVPSPSYQTSQPSGFAVDMPPSTVPSSVLSTDNSPNVSSLLNDYFTKQNEFMNHVALQMAPTPEEQAALAAKTDAYNNLNNFDASVEGGLSEIMKKPIPLEFQTGQEAALSRDSAFTRSSLARSYDAAVNNLNNVNATKQMKLDAAKFLFTANQQNLPNVISLYKQLAPENQGTQYNPSTGDLFSVTRNPLTGKVDIVKAGNIGQQKSYTSTNIETDPNTGQLIFVGVTATGQIDTMPLSGGGYGNSSSTSSNGTSNYVPSGTPQVANLGGLLANWTSGGKTMPGSGYTGAVLQNLPGVDLNTPAAQLISYIPQIAQGIAKAENISPALLAATNNPGAILFANQPGATPYKASNGYTYAKFNSIQDGYNAMNTLLAKKLGATSQTGNGPIPNLPPALAGAVKTINGIPYFDGGQLADTSQIKMAQYYGQQLGVPYIPKDNASKLQHIDVTMQNLSQMQADVSKILSPGLLGRIKGLTVNQIENKLQSNSTISAFKVYRDTAINAIQALAAGNGQGFRLNESEIATASSNLPSLTDNLETAQTKLSLVKGFLDKWQQEILPSSTSPQSSNATALLDQIIKQNGG